MKTYTFELIVKEGSDEFWEEIKGSGCDDVFDLVSRGLQGTGLYTGDNCFLKLTQYNDEVQL